MRMTVWEEERLLIFSAAELARRERERGLLLNAPEATAIICDAMLDAARAGATYEEVERAGRDAVAPAEVLPGVAALVDEVRLEVLMDDGTRLVVLHEPLGPTGDDGPGAVRRSTATGRGSGAATGPASADGPSRRPAIELQVRNTSTRIVRVSSHYPFERANPRLAFDRERAAGHRLDLPAGSTERWGPGETRTVRLVPFAGETRREGGAGR